MTAHFEGAEKALELVLTPHAPPLRARGESFFRELVEIADGTILRHTVTQHVDAYLLAESSLFVSDRHLSMLTCGRTRVYRAAESLIGALGLDAIASLSLTRLGERFPAEQHTSLADDVRVLEALLGGTHVRLGESGPHAGGAFVFETARERVAGEARVRVVGNDIAPEIAAVFTGEDRSRQASTLAPLVRTFGHALLDTFDFAPSGFSMNAMRGHETFAVHVTPEPAASYVSVVASVEDEEIIREALALFRPRTCLVTSEQAHVLPGAYRVVHAHRVDVGGRVLFVTEAVL